MEQFGGLIIAVIVVVLVIGFQIASFITTRKRIEELRTLFASVKNLTLKKFSVTSSILRSKERLSEFLAEVQGDEELNEEILEELMTEDEHEKMELSLLSLSKTKNSTSLNNRFNSILDRTNEYLSRNIGTSAELGVLEDICDSQKDALDDEIHNSLNVPLYLGLAGTFIGIITGLIGIDFGQIFGENSNLDGLQHLLYGIIVAMTASFLGLGLTVYNSAVSYKKALSSANDGKEDYMNFLRRELMPLLSSSMAASLNSLKGVLGHFVDKFGRNLDAYADSAELLNDNLEQQHLVLHELNQLSLTETANEIARVFSQLNNASASFSVFHQYQQDLNTTISNVSNITIQIQDVLNRFNSFSTGLELIIRNQNQANELQQEFKTAITTHFPTGSDAREIWRKEFDLFISEGKKVSESLSEQLSASTEHIQHFVSENQDFFNTFNKMQEVLSSLIQYTNVQAQCYNDLKGEIANLRKDYKDAQLQSVELHEATLKAVEEMTKAIKEKK